MSRSTGAARRALGPEVNNAASLVVADLDFSLIAIAKSAADPVGHYSRPDVMRLLINRSPNPVVVDRSTPVEAPSFVDADQLAADAAHEVH